VTDSDHAIVDRSDGRNPWNPRPPLDAGTSVLPALLTIQELAGLLNCSKRTVYRLNDAGHLPRPVRLGTLLRWSRATIETWIAEGCPKPERSTR
jgi:excisionase family DNA binding protein